MTILSLEIILAALCQSRRDSIVASSTLRQYPHIIMRTSKSSSRRPIARVNPLWHQRPHVSSLASAPSRQRLLFRVFRLVYLHLCNLITDPASASSAVCTPRNTDSVVGSDISGSLSIVMIRFIISSRDVTKLLMSSKFFPTVLSSVLPPVPLPVPPPELLSVTLQV